jgi:hypothetical protein
MFVNSKVVTEILLRTGEIECMTFVAREKSKRRQIPLGTLSNLVASALIEIAGNTIQRPKGSL